MEASVAQAAGEAAEGAEAPEAAAGLDPNEVMSRFDAMQGSMEEMRAQLSQQQQVPQDVVEEPEDYSWLDPATEGFDPGEFQQNIAQMVRQAAQEAAAPALQQTAEMQRAQAAAALRTEFPEIGDPETAKNVMSGAQEFAGAIINDIAPTLRSMGLPDEVIQAIGAGIVSSPAAWRGVYLGAKGLDAAKAETPIDPSAGLLEGGSGPRPGAQEVQDPAQRIVAARGGSILPF